MARWNERPAYTNQPRLLGSTVSRSDALQSAAVYGGVALAAAGASQFGLPMLAWLHLPVAGLGAALLLAVAAGLWGLVATLSGWRDSNARAHATASLDVQQRQLMGLPPAPPPRAVATPEAAPGAARTAALLATPVTPAQRLTPLMAPGRYGGGGSVGAGSVGGGVGGTPGSTHSLWGAVTASPGTTGGGAGARRSPWSAAAAVATPDELSGYLAAYGGSDGGGGSTPGIGGIDGGAAAELAGGGGVSPRSPSPGGGLMFRLRSFGGAAAAAASGLAAGAAGAAGAAAAAAAAAAGGGLADGQQQQQQGGDAHHHQGPAGSPPLRIGRDAPSYRPSMLPRKVAAPGGGAAGAAGGVGAVGGEAAGGAAQPGGDEAAEAGRIMQEALRMEVFQLVSCIERLREWFALSLLAPLAELMARAHEEPNALLAALAGGHEQAPQLPPIAALLGVDAASEASAVLPPSSFGVLLPAAGASLFSHALSTLRGGGQTAAAAAAGSGGAGGGAGAGGGGAAGAAGGSAASSSASVEDAVALTRGLMERLRCSQLPPGYDPTPLLLALHRYAEALLLLSGRRPGELLPPAPASYIAARVWQLARGTCVKAFNWNGGGEHAGTSWTPDLPCDSGLLFYLFAAFLDAPGWHFPPPGAGGGAESSRGAPLFLGVMRAARQPGAYSALLAFRPDAPGPQAVAVIGTNLASRAPRFSLMCGGQQITLSERDGLFKALLMWLKFHAEQRQGLVGGRFLSEAALGRLSRVLEPGEGGPPIPQRVFRWWYPPNEAL